MTAREAVASHREGAVGVITLRSFTVDVADRVQDAMRELERGAPPSGYVIDLRGNGGGTVQDVVAVVDIFLDGGEIGSIVGVEGCGFPTQPHSAREGDRASGRPIVLLVDSETSSGAEWFAAALIDNGRARAIGQRTRGRGDIQTVIPLHARRAWLALTSGALVSPSGARIEAGIEPTETVPPSDGGRDYPLERALELLR